MVVFNGTDRLIEITDPSILTLDAEKDIYSAWKVWSQDSDNSKYAPAFSEGSVFGGNPTISGQTAPKYFFLTNFWRVFVDNGQVVNVGLNLYTENFSTPYIVASGSGISDRNSDAVNVNEQEIRSQSFLLGAVYLDVSTSNLGTAYPIGTPSRRSNNITDSIIIAEREGLKEINQIGVVVANSSINLDGIKVLGGSGSSNVLILTGATTNQSDFEKIILAGELKGLSRVNSCILGSTGLGGVIGVEGRIKDSIINNTSGLIQKSGGAGTLLDNCSFITPDDQQVTFNANGEGFGFRDCTGNILLTNVTKPEALQVNIKGAIIELDSSCTDGTITFTGYGEVIDNSNGTTVINNLNTGSSGSNVWTLVEKDNLISDTAIIKDQSEISATNAINKLNE